jgi:predicted GIY-YIG superfamily endonuclease
MWCVYVLRGDKDGNLYIGSTNNLERRMHEHKNGECISTAKRRPLTLETYIVVKTEKQARALERYLKTGSGTAILKKRVLQSM